MSNPIYFAPYKVALVDPRTGIINREWYLFFQALWQRSGGAIGQSNDDLLQNNANAIGSGDLLMLISSGDQAAAQAPPSIALPVENTDLAQSPPSVVLSTDDFESMVVQLSFCRDQISEILKSLQDVQQAVVVN